MSLNRSKMSKMDTNAIVGAYRVAAAEHGQATETGEYKVANKSADRIAAIYAELRTRNEREALIRLLGDEESGVRCWAGAHALEFCPEKGEPVLLKLAAVQGTLVGLAAQNTLDAWCKGVLQFP